MAIGLSRVASRTSSSWSFGMWTCLHRLRAGGQPARSQALRRKRSSSIAAAGRPTNSSARHASGP
eukprot:12140802-Alexandrium_andersonii.AAC.1